MYGLIGSFKAAQGRRGDLVKLLLAEAGALPGCLSYVVAEDPADEETIWVTEVWTDAAAHKASLQLPAVKAVIAQAMPLIAAFGEHRETRPVGGHAL
jgi:quinol monooxygenase YgiN